jgi:hypothetical protein
MRITLGEGDWQTQIYIELPRHKKRIGVMLSGGADSAALLWLLCLERKFTGTDHELIPFTVPRTDGAWIYAGPIVRWIREYHECDLPDPIRVGDPSLHHSEQGRSGEREARLKHGIEHIYYGSQQPPDTRLIELPGIYPNRPNRVELPGTTCPFALCDKRHTLAVYEMYKIWPLIELTHSCTAQVDGRCGKCYNCVERDWALKALGHTDPGVL